VSGGGAPGGPARSGPDVPAVRDAIAAGEALRDALREYRSRFGAAARELAAAEKRPAGDSPAGFDALRADWERTVAAFRETVDRVGTAQKTLARDR